MKMNKTKELLLGALVVVCLVMTFVTRRSVDNQEVFFTEVEARVVSADSERLKLGKSRVNHYIVIVEYQDREYELENVHALYPYQKGMIVKVYLSGGRLYANREGVETSTPAAKAYFVFLIGTFVLGMVWLCFLPVLFRKKEEQSGADRP